jgi:hypothetical protein
MRIRQKSKDAFMSKNRLESLKIKAKMLQKAKKKSGKPILLKDAFAMIAKAAGFGSWQDLKSNLEANEALCPRGYSAYWKAWYASYEEAVSHLVDARYLLPYQKDFFICDENYIKFLGIEISDPDLKSVGSNWVKPLDMKAYDRLVSKIKNRNSQLELNR